MKNTIRIWAAIAACWGLAVRAAADVVEIGVTVNGTDVALGSGAGWTLEDGVVTLQGERPFVLSGSNTTDDVRVAVRTRPASAAALAEGDGVILTLPAAAEGRLG